MIHQVESNYDCANASEDLPRLLEELESLRASGDADQEHMNRVENQIHFIRNKCRIH